MFDYALWLSLSGYLVGCALLRRRRGIVLLASVLGGLLALVSSAQLVSQQVAGTGINEAVWYHLVVGLEGAGFDEYRSTFWLVAVLLMGCLLYTWLASRLVRSLSAGFVAMILGYGVAFGAWTINPGMQDLSATLGAAFSGESTEELPDDLVLPRRVSLRDGVDHPRNLVLIYAESLEAGYFDEERFPGLLPHLGEMREEGLSFDRVSSLPGTTWTIGGMVASQCGLPLVTASDMRNAKVDEPAFLPEARCLGDILEDHGYRQHYMGGADRNFADKFLFYRTHGTDRVDGRDELVSNLKDAEYLNDWGLYDDSLLEMATSRFDLLAESDEPFALTLLTLDTHHPRGHWSARCHGSPYANGKNPMLNAVHCADRLLSDFIQHVQRHEDTLVVVVSDHLAFPNTIIERLQEKQRYDLFMMPGETPEPSPQTSRQASTLDIAPTVLNKLGFSVSSLGYGRNLLADDQTFMEQHDAPAVALRERFPVVRGLWQYPTLREGVHVDPERHQARVGEHAFSIPAMVSLDEDLRLERTAHADELYPALKERDEPGYFLWFQYCDRLPVVLKRESTDSGADLCWQVGSAEGIARPARSLDNGSNWLSFSALQPLLNAKPDQELSRTWWRYLQRRALGGALSIHPSAEGQMPLAVVAKAQPLPGRSFFFWDGVEGARRYEAEVIASRWELGKLAPVFDHQVDASTRKPGYRSAWAAVMVKGGRVLAEHLSPSDSVNSVARVVQVTPDGQEMDVRATGGFLMKDWYDAYIRRDGEPMMALRRGINLWVKTPGGRHAAHHFDTHAEPEASDRLIETLASVPDGATLFFATHDEFSRNLSADALDYLQSLGLMRSE